MRLLRFGCVLAIMLLAPSLALGEKRVALVIGNSAYRNAAELANPKNDAADMAEKLQSLGFAVTTGVDLDLAAMRTTVREFIKQLEGSQMAMMFYAGHGLQVDGVNYMVPVDAKLSSPDDLEFETMPMDPILTAMERNAKVNLVFLDACRDNPLARVLARSMGTRSAAVGSGLARIGSGVGSLIAFATQPGNVALDGSGRNSPFTTALLKHLGTPGQDITRDLIRVRREVLEATEGRQVPWENSSLTGEIVLIPGESGASNDAAQADGSFEMTYWESIKTAEDKSFFKKYLERFPAGMFAELATMKIASIEAQEQERKKLDLAKLEAERSAKAKQAPEASGGAEEGTDPNLARRIKVASLGTDADPRLVKALSALGQYQIRHGFFRGNLYIAVLTWGSNWETSRKLAESAGGHLVTIADRDENKFVYELFRADNRFVAHGDGGMSKSGPWIGLFQPKGAKEPGGGWRWVTNEPLDFPNWGQNQPDNFGGRANVANFWSQGASDPVSEQRPIRWDDRIDDENRGFIVEFEASDGG